MILYFADKNFRILGTASTSLSGGYVITDDTKKEEVETGIATLDCTVAYTDDTRSDIEGWCRAGNYVLAYYGKETAADMDIVNLFMITTTELSVLDHTIKFESEDSGLDLLNNLAKEYTGTEQMSAADYINKFLEKTGFRLRNNNVSKNPKKLEWTSTDTVTKRLADIAEKFDAELTYGFSVKGLTVSDRWVDIADETGRDTKINLYIDKEVNNITVKNTIENLATALYATGKDNLTLIGFTVPEEDKEKYQIDPDGNLVSLEALTKWARVDYSSKDSFSGNLYQRFESSDTASQADLYKLAKEKLDSISDIETNYEIDIADLPPGVGIGDRVNIVDDAGNTYISGRILELETSVTDGTKKATLGEYVIKDSGISELVENLASSFANLSKVRELYTWIAYADTIDGDGFSFSPEGKEYLGTAVNQLTEEAGTDPAVYKWVKTKGEQGEKGPTGAPGEKGDPGAPGEKGDPGEDGYSPTVDLSTGASGSTVLTVTNKTGQSSTELKDQKARNDADNATDSAELAQQQAESATTAANNAQETADKAQSSADKAQNTATEAAKTADNYVSTDSIGIMVSENSGETKETPINATKNNVLITEKDIRIRNGQKVLATYGETTNIGEPSGGNISISKTGIELHDGVYMAASIRAITENEEEETAVDSFDGQAADAAVSSGKRWESTYSLEDVPNRIKSVTLTGPSAVDMFLPNAPIGWYGYSRHNSDISVYLDGSYEDTKSWDWTVYDTITIVYTAAARTTGTITSDEVNTKTLKTGTVIAAGIIAGERFDASKISNVQKRLIIGSKKDTIENANAAAILENGDCRLGGDVYINCNDDSTGGTPLGTVISGTGTAKATTGRVSINPSWYRCGNLVQMEFGVAATAAVNPGKNLATGTITKIPRPVTTYGLRAVSYYGNNANVLFVSQEGGFTVRNCGSDALAKGNDAIGIFTYITDGTML